jgi:hypothetical protein
MREIIKLAIHPTRSTSDEILDSNKLFWRGNVIKSKKLVIEDIAKGFTSRKSKIINGINRNSPSQKSIQGRAWPSESDKYALKMEASSIGRVLAIPLLRYIPFFSNRFDP